jgi:uncharacterized protein with FMN-binding domain
MAASLAAMHFPARKLTSVLGAAALALPVADAAAAATQSGAATKKLTGQTYQADRWGTVKIDVTVRVTKTGRKTKVKFVDLGGSYSYSSGRSQYIMSRALPLLRQEFLEAQSANVDLISGATATSQAFEESLTSALAQLKA